MRICVIVDLEMCVGPLEIRLLAHVMLFGLLSVDLFGAEPYVRSRLNSPKWQLNWHGKIGCVYGEKFLESLSNTDILCDVYTELGRESRRYE